MEHLIKLIVSNNLIIVGDFNAKNKLWGSPVNDYRGNLITKLINQFDLICLNKGSGTHLNNNGSLSHLDLVLCSSNLGFNLDCEVLDDLWGSDHFPLFISLDCNVEINLINASLFNYSKADWALFYSALDNDSSFQDPISDVDHAYNKLVLAFKNARDISIPKRSTIFKHKYSPFWTPQCSEAKALKKKAEKSLRKNKNLENQIQFKKCKAIFKRVLSVAKTNYWEKFCSGINKQTKLKYVWETISRLKGKKSKACINVKNIEGNLVPKDSLPDLFANNFKAVCSNSNIDPKDFKNRGKTVSEFIQVRSFRSSVTQPNLKTDSSLLNKPFQISELQRVLKTVNVRSSPGCDDIPFSFFKHCPDSVINHVLKIINLSWESNTIPQTWKTSIIKPILKSNKPASDISSYRPISLAPSFSKLIEKMITIRLTWYLQKNHLLNSNQAGFRKSFSTSDPIIRLSNEAEIAVNSGNYTVAVMIDFKSAFDLLWIDGLLIKMVQLNISGTFLN